MRLTSVPFPFWLVPLVPLMTNCLRRFWQPVWTAKLLGSCFSVIEWSLFSVCDDWTQLPWNSCNIQPESDQCFCNSCLWSSVLLSRFFLWFHCFLFASLCTPFRPTFGQRNNLQNLKYEVTRTRYLHPPAENTACRINMWHSGVKLALGNIAFDPEKYQHQLRPAGMPNYCSTTKKRWENGTQKVEEKPWINSLIKSLSINAQKCLG